MFALTGPVASPAATTPTLGAAATYGILSSTYTNTSAGTTINGDVGFTTGPAVAPLGAHTNYGAGAPYAAAGTDQGSALSALASQACTFTFPAGAINLSTDTTHGTIGVYTPGVYCSSGAMDVGGPLNLSGSGTYIFRPVGALTTTAGAVVTLSGASACDVFWTPSAATTFAANTTFAGTVIGNAGITVGANTTWTGRALAFGGTDTSDTDTLTVPTCTAPPPPPATVCTLSANPISVQIGSSSALSWTTTNANAFSIDQSVGSVSPVATGSRYVTPLVTTTYTGTATVVGGSATTCTATVTITALPPPAFATLHVVKHVVNNNGGTAVASSFTLHVKLSGADVTGSPAVGVESPGTSYALASGTYVVSENTDASYAQSFSGACDPSGTVTLLAGDDKTCTITNTDISPPPPVVKNIFVPAAVGQVLGASTSSVPAPALPNTGFPPEGNDSPWNVAIPAGILMVIAISLALALKKRAI